MKTAVFSAASGALFALGLVVSGMTSPSKVLGFLDVFGTWDPSLAFVMLGAIAVHAALYRVIATRGPLGGVKLQLPTRKDIDARLVVGSALFGVGWGLAGVCPGPGLVGAMSGALPFLVFVGAMLAGMALVRVWEATREHAAKANVSAPT